MQASSFPGTKGAHLPPLLSSDSTTFEADSISIFSNTSAGGHATTGEDISSSDDDLNLLCARVSPKCALAPQLLVSLIPLVTSSFSHGSMRFGTHCAKLGIAFIIHGNALSIIIVAPQLPIALLTPDKIVFLFRFLFTSFVMSDKMLGVHIVSNNLRSGAIGRGRPKYEAPQWIPSACSLAVALNVVCAILEGDKLFICSKIPSSSTLKCGSLKFFSAASAITLTASVNALSTRPISISATLLLLVPHAILCLTSLFPQMTERRIPAIVSLGLNDTRPLKNCTQLFKKFAAGSTTYFFKNVPVGLIAFSCNQSAAVLMCGTTNASAGSITCFFTFLATCFTEFQAFVTKPRRCSVAAVAVVAVSIRSTLFSANSLRREDESLDLPLRSSS